MLGSMQRSEHITVRVDPARVRANAEGIARRTGVDVYAVVKADGYGLGGREVARAVRDVVYGYYCFGVREAVDAGLKELGKPVLAMAVAGGTAADFVAAGVR